MVNQMQLFLRQYKFSKLTWEGKVLVIAGIYNVLWGTWVVLFPSAAFSLSGAKSPFYLELWQCVGMIVAVYGLGYFIAGSDPYRHWPITLVGLLGKIFGPIGFVKAITDNVFPLKFGANIIFNDLIWWVPFTLILLNSYKKNIKGSF
jgi:small multidrug resistance pump